MSSSTLLEAVAVTAELCGRVFTAPAAKVFVDDLSGFPEPAVLAALRRCRREVRGVLTVQDVVSRIDDGRPGPQEAWAMMPVSEADSIVWSDEMAEAYRVAAPLIADGEMVAARMAFLETYTKAINEARDQRKAPCWSVSLGHDPRGREQALLLAVEKGRLTLGHARDLVPSLSAPAPEVLALLELSRAEEPESWRK